MERLPRLLAVMGSGETSPTMVKTHRRLLARLGPPPVPALVLDTPFGFQGNAGELAAKAVEYFRESVGQALEVASLRAAGGDPVAYEGALARLRDARYVFAGPGSPSYALRQWQATLVPKVLAEKLQAGGCITFASAAALTLGLATVPVYEIYKVGEAPHWLEGLDLLGEVGIRAAVIPHFNNAEGGTHDTRFCYLGAERLSLMERELPDDAFVLGVDEHTALILDLDAGTAVVEGIGVVTVRRRDSSSELPAGTTVSVDDLIGLGTGRGSVGRPPAPEPAAGVAAPAPAPLLDEVARLEATFAAALEGRDAEAAVRAVLELEEELARWAHETFASDELDRARAALRGMIVRLGDVARTGAQDPAEVVGPYVEALLAVRAGARAGGRWDDADAVRDALVALGVEVGDTPEGATWRLAP